VTWRDELRRVTLPDGRVVIGASFRGVPFFVDSSERGGGRRAIVHEFPFREDPFVEDLGRRARTFRIDGYVIGDDYVTQRDTLLSALEDETGAGELVHPYHGVRRAVCLNYAVREERAAGRFAAFSLEFAEAPTQTPVPVEVVDLADQVDDSADDAVEAADAELVEQYDSDDLPAFALESAATALTNAAAALEEHLAPLVSATQELAELTGQIQLLTAQASALVRTPSSLLTEFRSAITGLVETMLDAPGDVMEALFEAYDADLGPLVDPITATRERELANQTALFAAIRRVIAIEAARLAPLVEYESIEAATAARDRVAELLDEQAGEADDAAYPALVDLRSKVLRAVPGGQAFGSVVTVTRKVPIPSILLAYQLYGSTDRELDIIARNGIAHPGFIAGELRVLSDG
jgi:prophage DNA circulation protein